MTKTYIDMTPTWEGLLPALIAVVVDHEPTPEGWQARRNVEGELARMAQAADRWNAYVKDLRAEHDAAYGDEHNQRCPFCGTDEDA